MKPAPVSRFRGAHPHLLQSTCVAVIQATTQFTAHKTCNTRKKQEMDITTSQPMERALQDLLDKYGITTNERFVLTESSNIPGALHLLPGYELIDPAPNPAEVPLLSWRVRRSFTELRKIVEDAVVEHVCLLRFSCLASTNGWSLHELIYREVDLCEYITGGKTNSVFAVWEGRRSVNIILSLNTGVLCSVEISLQLPAGADLQERHEIIGRRGTAGDRVVDTQAPQQSVYCFTQSGDSRFTDTDMELFGFNPGQTEHIRGAFEVYRFPALRAAWTAQHRHLTNVVRAAATSGEIRQKVTIS